MTTDEWEKLIATLRDSYGDDLVDRAERAEHQGALVLRNERSAQPFDGPDRSIAVQAHNKAVAQAPGLLEQVDVPRMEHVEAAVREDGFHNLTAGPSLEMILMKL